MEKRDPERAIKVFLRENLNDRMDEEGVSSEDLAFELNVSLTSIRRWGKGVTKPSEENLEKLADRFNWEIEEIKNYEY